LLKWELNKILRAGIQKENLKMVNKFVEIQNNNPFAIKLYQKNITNL